MSAIDLPVRFLTFLLRPRGRPHMARRVPSRMRDSGVDIAAVWIILTQARMHPSKTNPTNWWWACHIGW